MTYHLKPVTEFLEDAYWKAVHNGAYRVADKLKETLSELDQVEGKDQMAGELSDAEDAIEDLKETLRDIRKRAIEDPALGYIVEMVDSAL